MSKNVAFAFVVTAALAAAAGIPAVARELPPEMKYNVQLFEHSDYNKKGGRVAVIYMGAGDVAHYKKNSTLKNLHDKISSAIWNLPSGCKLKLYEHVDFKGKVKELSGSGRLSGMKDFNDKVSSHKWVGKAACDKFKPKAPDGSPPGRDPVPGGGTPTDPGGCIGRCQVFTVK